MWAALIGAFVSLLCTWGPWETLVPFIVKNALHGSAIDLGLVFGAGGVGSVLAALIIGQRGGLPRRPLTILYLFWALGMLMTTGFGVVNAVWQAMIVAFIAEGSITVLVVVWVTLLQRLVAPDLLGRVSSLDWMVSIGGVPISFAIVGPLASTFGAQTTMIWAGLLGAAVTIGFMFIPGAREPERDGSLASPEPLRRAPVNFRSMEYTHLGRLGLVVSRLTLGTMNFGPHSSEGDSHAIMDAAIAHGVNFFDTANVYGRHLGVGATEEIIGRWIAKGGGRREKVVLASKVYGQMGDWPNEGRLSVLAIRKACEASLKRLRTDHIDLYQMHHIDRDAWWNEVWQAMELLVQQGKILYVGSSNFAGWHIARANEIARARNFLGLASEQSLYNLSARTVELEVLPAVREYGMGFIPYSPLSGGLLAGALSKVEEGRRSSEYLQGEIQEHRDQLERWEAALRRARRTALRRRARVAPCAAGRHVADHRAAHDRPAQRVDARARDPSGRRRAQAARRDLPGSGRCLARGLRLVAERPFDLGRGGDDRGRVPLGVGAADA